MDPYRPRGPFRDGEAFRPDGCHRIRFPCSERTAREQVGDAVPHPVRALAERDAAKRVGGKSAGAGAWRAASAAARVAAHPLRSARGTSIPRAPSIHGTTDQGHGYPAPGSPRTTGTGTRTPVGSSRRERDGSTCCSWRTSGAAIARRGRRAAHCAPTRQTEQSHPSAACEIGTSSAAPSGPACSASSARTRASSMTTSAAGLFGTRARLSRRCDPKEGWRGRRRGVGHRFRLGRARSPSGCEIWSCFALLSVVLCGNSRRNRRVRNRTPRAHRATACR